MYEMQPVKKKSGCLGKIVKGALIIVGLFIAFVVIVALFAPSKPPTITVGGSVALSAATPKPAAKQAVALVVVATDAPVPTEAPTVAPTAIPMPVVGQDVIVDEVRWKILTVENLGNKITDDNQFTKDLTTSGKFIKVRFEIENRSKDMLSFVGLDLTDSQDRKYTRSSDVFSVIDQSEFCMLENLNPNITKTCTHIYEVPADAQGLKAKASDLKLFGGAEALIDLGM